MGVQTVWVRLGRRSYPVRIGAGLRHRVAGELDSLPCPTARIGLVADETTRRLYGEAIRASLEQSGRDVVAVTVPAGERAKSLRELEKLWRFWAQARLGREGLVLAVGGGVVGDLAGFAAATYMRGIPWVILPTTLLAMVDSAVGGKTGVDLPEGKNLVGAFFQPSLVIADVEVLETLPSREFRAGMAEVLKYGFIEDPGLLSLVEQLGTHDALVQIIARCVEVKARIVEEDEEERSGKRAVLNFGHTLGHALEKALGYQGLLHGEAISIGMWAAGLLSHWKSGLPEKELEQIREALLGQGLPVKLPGVNWQAVCDALAVDKKKKAKTNRWVLLRSLGSPCLREDISQEELERVFQEVFPSEPQGTL
jgi:3-dehydroquinate synthase